MNGNGNGIENESISSELQNLSEVQLIEKTW